MTLAEFLTARLDEDEASVLSGDCRCGDEEPQRPDCPDRVLAEVDAKRRIVARYEDALNREHEPEYSTLEAVTQRQEYEDWVLPLLAVPYDTHPDYDEAWRP